MLTSIAREEVQRLQRDESAQASRSTLRDLAAIFQQRTCEKLDAFNRAAAIYRESIADFDGE